MRFSDLTLAKEREYLDRAHDLIYSDLRTSYANSKEMVRTLAKCLYKLDQLANGETPENITHPNILNVTSKDFRKE
jgi:hypothetical protein